MGFQAPLLTYFGEPKQTNAIQLALKKEQAKLQLTGTIGSSFAVTASAGSEKAINPTYLFLETKKMLHIL